MSLATVSVSCMISLWVVNPEHLCTVYDSVRCSVVSSRVRVSARACVCVSKQCELVHRQEHSYSVARNSSGWWRRGDKSDCVSLCPRPGYRTHSSHALALQRPFFPGPRGFWLLRQQFQQYSKQAAVRWGDICIFVLDPRRLLYQEPEHLKT